MESEARSHHERGLQDGNHGHQEGHRDQARPAADRWTNNNLQQLFTKAPGLLVTEQNTPGQFNFSYRGLGNPQESEFVTVLMDGIPLASDWIGFPTLYFLPVPQSVSEIQEIRGGSSLLYGPRARPGGQLS